VEAGKLNMEIIEFNLRESLDGAMKAISIRAHQKVSSWRMTLPPGCRMPCWEILPGCVRL